MTSSQRRSATRQAAKLLCGSSSDPTLFGRTRDLSYTGAFVETAVRPAVGKLLDVALAWREHVHSCSARVVRHAEGGVALAFVDPSPEFRKVLELILGRDARRTAPS